MTQQIVGSERSLRRHSLTTQEQLADSRQRKQELRCFFTRPFGHRWDNPLGDKRALYDRGVEGIALDSIRTCLGCGRKEKYLSSTPSHTDYTWCRLNPYQE